MKKRMLITTIVMMLVLAVALTTSSLAWFSASQATVTATGGQFTAASAGSAVSIGVGPTYGTTNWKSSTTMNNTNNTDLMPLCAIEELESYTTSAPTETVTLADFVGSTYKFNGARFLNQGETQIFPLEGAEQNLPYESKLEQQANTVVFVKNLDTNGTFINTLDVKLTITSINGVDPADAPAPNFYVVLSTGDGSSVLRAAVISKVGGYFVFNFRGEDATPGMALSVAEANSANGSAEIVNQIGKSATVSFTGLDWAAQDIYQVNVYAWYEGKTLDVNSDECTHIYSLEFTAGVEEAGA